MRHSTSQDWCPVLCGHVNRRMLQHPPETALLFPKVSRNWGWDLVACECDVIVRTKNRRTKGFVPGDGPALPCLSRFLLQLLVQLLSHLVTGDRRFGHPDGSSATCRCLPMPVQRHFSEEGEGELDIFGPKETRPFLVGGGSHL